MSTTVNTIEEIKELLNEEKWTGQTVANYTKKDFGKLDEIVETALKGEYATELMEECKKFLANTPKSVMALYIMGIISLEQGLINDTYIYQVINQFQDQDKPKLVEFLAEKRLDYSEDKPALEILNDVYTAEGREEEMIEVWKRLARIDFENGEIPRKLAEFQEANGDIEEAIFNYKAALRRYVKKGNVQQIEKNWHKLTELAPDDLDFFYSMERDIARKNEEKASELLNELANYYLEQNNNEKSIELLKKVMQYSPKSNDARFILVECFKEKYKDHSQLEEYIKKTKINQTWRNFSEALNDFEKHIAFDVDNWVYHKSWKIGKITAIEDETFTIDFDGKLGHKMTLPMALKSLEVLSEGHLWLIKKQEPEKLKEDSEEGIKFVLETLFQSFGNEASLKDIKKEITNGIVPTKEWNKWWNKAKKIIKKDSIFGSSYEKKDHYFLREKLLSFGEETFLKFQNMKSFQHRLDIMEDYLKHSDDEKQFDNENSMMMLQYFVDIANDKERITETTIQSYLLLRKIERKDETIKTMNLLKIKPDDIANGISNYTRVFEELPDTDSKKELIELLRKWNNDWVMIISEFLKTKPNRAHNTIMDELYSHNKTEELKSIIDYITNNYRNNSELFVWTCRYLYSEEEVFQNIVDDEGSIIYNLIQLIDTLGRLIDNKKEVTLNRRILNQVMDLLFDANKGVLAGYLEKADSDSLKKCVLMVKGSVYLDEKTKLEFLDPYKEQFADLFETQEEEEDLHDFLVTKKAYNDKVKQLEHIINVEIPQNSKDIGEAQEKGDLRENAEYQSALEKQKNLHTMQNKLKDEIAKAKIIQPKNVDLTQSDVGTKITLLNLDTNEKEIFTLLGEWDSNPEQDILSYKSPFGAKLLGHKVDEEFEVKIAKNKKKYKLLSIELAKEITND